MNKLWFSSAPIILFLSSCAFTPATPTIETTYDPYLETEMITAGPFDISYALSWDVNKGTSDGDSVYLIYFTRNGALDSQSTDWLYLENHELYFLIDNQSYHVGSGSHDGNVMTTSSGSPYALETLTYKVKPKLIRKLSQGKSVSGRVGSTEFTVTNEQLDTLKKFVSRHL